MAYDPFKNGKSRYDGQQNYRIAKATLWSHLRERKTGFKFSQDFLIDGCYHVDFACTDLRLAIVIDCDPDANPVNFPSSKYWSWLRFKSDDILKLHKFVDLNIDKCKEQSIKFKTGDDMLYVRPYLKDRDKMAKHPELRIYTGSIDGDDKHIFGFGMVSTINNTENVEISMCKEVLANGYKIEFEKFIIHNHIDYTNHSFLPDDICPMCEYVFNKVVTNDYLQGNS